MKTASKILGDQAELFVVQELVKQGFAICEQNYQKLYGEIDIIAQKKELLVFVEVKIRTTNYIPMHEIITGKKKHKIGLVAQEYISRHNIDNLICRFDVALINIKNNTFILTYIPNAFELN